jgi:Tol biopolymer transport system component
MEFTLRITSGECERVAWSPNGKLLRFSQYDLRKERHSIWEVSAEGGKIRQLLPDWKESLGKWNGRWTADGAYYIFMSVQDG